MLNAAVEIKTLQLGRPIQAAASSAIWLQSCARSRDRAVGRATKDYCVLWEERLSCVQSYVDCELHREEGPRIHLTQTWEEPHLWCYLLPPRKRPLTLGQLNGIGGDRPLCTDLATSCLETLLLCGELYWEFWGILVCIIGTLSLSHSLSPERERESALHGPQRKQTPTSLWYS